MQNIAGYTYVRNGFEYGVPFIESIKSVLPVCEEFIVVVGDSTDGTREAIEALNSPKIKIVDTQWDMNLRKGGKVFAQQSNIGIDAINGDWVFHIQADEVMHENDLPKIKEAVERYSKDLEVDGLLFPFLHFWGDYNHIQNSRRVHRNEIRVFKNRGLIRAYRDSQGFRKYKTIDGYESGAEPGQKLKVKFLNAPVYHYNGVKDHLAMHNKIKNFNYFYGADIEAPENSGFNYHTVPRVTKFKGLHPVVMRDKIEGYKHVFEHDRSQAAWKPKDKLIQPIEDLFGYRFGEYKNYILLK